MEEEWTEVKSKKKANPKPQGPKNPNQLQHTTTQEEKKIVIKSRNPQPQVGQQQNKPGNTGGGGAAVQKKQPVKNVNRSQDVRATVLEKDTGNYNVLRNGLTMGKEIMKRRNELGLTQKELGVRIDEKASLVQEYEQGVAIPNQKVITKFERELGVQLKGLLPKRDKTTADDEITTTTVTAK